MILIVRTGKPGKLKNFIGFPVVKSIRVTRKILRAVATGNYFRLKKTYMMGYNP